MSVELRYEIANMEKTISNLRTELIEKRKVLLEQLKAELNLKVGSVIQNKKLNKIFVIKSFELEFCDFTNQEEVRCSLYRITDSFKINKKIKDDYKIFVKPFIEVGVYDFETDKITFNDKYQKNEPEKRILDDLSKFFIEAEEIYNNLKESRCTESLKLDKLTPIYLNLMNRLNDIEKNLVHTLILGSRKEKEFLVEGELNFYSKYNLKKEFNDLTEKELFYYLDKMFKYNIFIKKVYDHAYYAVENKLFKKWFEMRYKIKKTEKDK